MKAAEIAGPAYLTRFPSEVKHQYHSHLPRWKQTIECQSWKTSEAFQRKKMGLCKRTGLAQVQQGNSVESQVYKKRKRAPLPSVSRIGL